MDVIWKGWRADTTEVSSNCWSSTVIAEIEVLELSSCNVAAYLFLFYAILNI
jgi:hypothetical protein